MNSVCFSCCRTFVPDASAKKYITRDVMGISKPMYSTWLKGNLVGVEKTTVAIDCMRKNKSQICQIL
jgi:hypothetical protein